MARSARRAANPAPQAPPLIRSSDRAALATTVAVVLAAVTLKMLTASWSYLWLTVPLIVLLGVASLVVRRLRLDSVMVLIVQVVLLVAYIFAMAQSLSPPGAGLLQGWGQLYVDAREHILTQAAPMAPHAGVTLLFATCLGIIMILTDVMVQSINRPAWALVPLVMVWAVPAFGLREGVPFWTVAVLFAGYLGILLADSINVTAWWPRGVRRRDTDRGGAGIASGMALLIAIPTMALALIGGLALPVLANQGWGGARPKGADGPLTMSDPSLDLRRNLNQPENRTVIRYRTDQSDGTYLRLTTLPVFDGTGWHSAGMQLQDLPVGPPPGVQGVDYDTRTTQIQVTEFASEYLPVPYAPENIQAQGEWKYDPQSLTVLATGENRTEATADLQYTVTSLDVEPDGKGLSQAPTGNPPDARFTVPIPGDLPQELFDLSQQLTASQPTPALKAAAIQNYLRSDEFTYSTEPQPGTGYGALENFLFKDKKGYCEQFAGSMAVLARLAGIPSRVAIGFLPGRPEGNDHVVSIRDYHAWPELYFEGYGWVRFEPTPNVGTAPSWTVVGGEDGEGGEGQGQSPTPEPTEEGSPTPEPTPEPTPTAPPTEGGEEAGTPDWVGTLARVGIVVGVLAGLALLAATPAIIRRRRRLRRLDATGDMAQRVEGAWAEVRDSVLDSGADWPKGSPRVIGALIAKNLDVSSARAMQVLSLTVERQRYARSNSVNADLAAMALEIRRGLLRDQDLSTRLAADWWPRSLWMGLFGRKG